MHLFHHPHDLPALPRPLGFVATMGALHAGHLAHVEAARAAGAEAVVLSIFVNPTQFGPNEDFSRYPRTLDDDLTACAGARVDAVYVPGVETMYPPNVPAAHVDVPAVTGQLEGVHRPGHFAGVGRVVLKLFHQLGPDLATFGRKDYQQLTLIKALVRDLGVPVRIVEVPTHREPDGLAMSSRNRYLSPAQRAVAPELCRALRRIADAAHAGNTGPVALEAQLRRDLLEAGFDAVDDAALRHRETLAPLAAGFHPADAVAIATARLGPTRLLDNLRLIDHENPS